jgi:hypothetical protein
MGDRYKQFTSRGNSSILRRSIRIHPAGIASATLAAKPGYRASRYGLNVI